MALPDGHKTRAEQCAKNIEIGVGWLQDDPLSADDAALVRKALKAAEKRVKELES